MGEFGGRRSDTYDGRHCREPRLAPVTKAGRPADPPEALLGNQDWIEVHAPSGTYRSRPGTFSVDVPL
jgi:hypothetical protein